MSTIAIVVTPPGGSPTDITDDVIFSTADFTTNMNAVPGTFSFTVRDPERTHSFATGYEIKVTIDGIDMFGGYVLQVSMTHLAPAADTTNISTYQLRAWKLAGADYNIILDKRVLRNTADYLNAIIFTGDTTDGAVLRDAVQNYADMTDFTVTGIDDVYTLPEADRREQGTKLKELFHDWSLFGGATYWVGGDKDIKYIAYETATKDWGFSDQPNGTTLFGFRDVTATEDGSQITNDALIWGGSQFAGASGGTVFARSQNATSQTTYGRWQTAETHFGEQNYLTSLTVTERANVIVNGPPGADVYGEQKGLRFPQWNFTFTWFADDVPVVASQRDHLVAGEISTIVMNVFSVTKLLPLRQLRISFPGTLEVDGTFKVEFTGTFGLQLSDPYTLWGYLQSQQDRVILATPTIVDGDSTSTTYGGIFNDEPTPATDGATTVFSIPFGYILGTTQVYLSGMLQERGIAYTESDNEAGEITMTVAPPASENLWVVAVTLAS